MLPQDRPASVCAQANIKQGTLDTGMPYRLKQRIRKSQNIGVFRSPPWTFLLFGWTLSQPRF
jgi:hypothetical protein